MSSEYEPPSSSGIYIRCKPVDENNRPISSSIISSDGNEKLLSNSKINDIINKVSFGGENNVPMAIIIGTITMIITYYIGNYVFNKIPINIINKEKDKAEL